MFSSDHFQLFYCSRNAQVTFVEKQKLKIITDVNRALPSLHGGWHEITRTVPLIFLFKVLICTFLVTAEYCLDTTQQLQEKLKQKVKILKKTFKIKRDAAPSYPPRKVGNFNLIGIELVKDT